MRIVLKALVASIIILGPDFSDKKKRYYKMTRKHVQQDIRPHAARVSYSSRHCSSDTSYTPATRTVSCHRYCNRHLVLALSPSGLPKGVINRVACFDSWNAGNIWPSGVCSNKTKTEKGESISGVTYPGLRFGPRGYPAAIW